MKTLSNESFKYWVIGLLIIIARRLVFYNENNPPTSEQDRKDLFDIERAIKFIEGIEEKQYDSRPIK